MVQESVCEALSTVIVLDHTDITIDMMHANNEPPHELDVARG